MAGNILGNHGTANQTITITVASLTNNSARESTVIDNTSNLFLDALVSLKLKSPAASTVATGSVLVYAYGTTNGGTTYSDSATGSDAAITLTANPNVRQIGALNIAADATTYNGGPFSVAAAFGGVLPAKWGIIVVNKTGGTLDSTGGNHVVQYQGIFASYT